LPGAEIGRREWKRDADRDSGKNVDWSEPEDDAVEILGREGANTAKDDQGGNGYGDCL
jgi:hypothetical protein